MRKTISTVILMMLSGAVCAMPKSCWIVEKMEGAGFFAADNYKQVSDRISSPITILFNGDSSLVSFHDLPLIQVSDYMMIGMNGDAISGVDASFIYFVDITKKKAIFTRVRNESASISTGVVSLVGDAKPCQ